MLVSALAFANALPRRSHHQYTSTARDFRRFLTPPGGDPPLLHAVTRQQVSAYLMARRQRKLPGKRQRDRGGQASDATCRRRYAVLSSMFSYWSAEYGFPSPIRRELHRQGWRRRTQPVHISADAMRTLVTSTRSDRFPGRDRILTLVFCCTGARIAEVAALRVGDLQLFATPPRVLLHGKGGKDRLAPLTEGLRTELAAWVTELHTRYPGVGDERLPLLPVLQRHHPEPRPMSVPAIRTQLDRLFRRLAAVDPSCAGMKLTPHKLRHSFALALVLGGVSIGAIRQLLDHVHLSTTSIYTQLDLRELGDQVQQLNPLLTALAPTEPEVQGGPTGG